MKKLITGAVAAPINTQYGTWLLSRRGDLIPVTLHVPSTTWISRGLEYLAPTDGEFLYTQGKISEEELTSIVVTNFLHYLDDNKITEYSITDVTSFNSYAELKYASTARQIMMRFIGGTTASLKNMLLDYTSFSALNQKWYSFLQNNYVKVSKFNNTLEFRISSDGYDWNENIIDDVLLNENYDFSKCRINIVKETAAGYKPYFQNATLDDILSYDDTVMSSTKLCKRCVINGKIIYIGNNIVIRYIKCNKLQRRYLICIILMLYQKENFVSGSSEEACPAYGMFLK